jgi:hypothetical protein
MDYLQILAPMFIASLGAGILNGQVPKVSMTVIPAERAGMASGIAGTVRFSGLVLGFAALGAVLFASVSGDVGLHFPLASLQDQAQMTRLITNGNFIGAAQVLTGKQADINVLIACFAHGYQLLPSVAAAMAFVAAVLTWWLTDAEETAPHAAADPGNVSALPD